MADYAISNVPRRVVYANSGVGPYAFTFEILDQTDIAVYRGSTLLTLTTDYSVTINTNGTGSVTLVTAGTGNITIVGAKNIQRTTDFTTGGDLFANSLNDELDNQTIFIQQVAETAERGLKAPVTDPTDINMTLPTRTARAGKTLAFDTNGNPVVGEDIGNWRGNWASGTAYTVRDLVKDASNYNVYRCNTAHTSTGSTPIKNNTDSAKWDLVVDAEYAAEQAQDAADSATAAASSASSASSSASSASSSASAASTSATNAASSASTASTQATNAANSASAASTSATNASNSATAAATSATNASNSATAASTSATNAANSATAASNSASTASTQATNAANSATAASTSATNASNSASAAATSATNASNSATAASTSATNSANSATAAASSATSAASLYDQFDDRYLGSKSSAPSVDNDGNALLTGALYFNTVDNSMKVWNGSIWLDAYASLSGALLATNNLSDLANKNTSRANLGVAIGVDVQAYDVELISAVKRGLFRKADPTIVAWTKTGNFTLQTATTLYIDVNGSIKTISSGTSITMPTATTGTDYAIWAKTDGTLEATSNHTSPPTANARKVGGFHYAAGGNATGQSGGNSTPQINEYSLWDLKFRPACNDPRGMTLVAGGFWVDIYLANTDCDANGTSKYNVTMADGSSPPKVPTAFGGNGSTTYGSLTWFESCELASAYGKRLLTQREFMAMAYGTTEASSVGTDQVSTILNAAYTSKWGVMQSTGVLWVWGDDRGGPFAGASWNANTEGRGSEYNAPNAVILGGAWASGSDSGSRCSFWYVSASHSSNAIGVRCACDHLLLD